MSELGVRHRTVPCLLTEPSPVFLSENRSLLYAETSGSVTKDKEGIYRDGDIIYSLPDKALLPYAEDTVSVDGMELSPIIKYYQVPKEIIESARQKILFR